MLISVTLVLMMMLMFAEIYGIAQQTITTQKGIAENDQKARLLTQILHRDLNTRTFRSVYPFRREPSPDFATVSDQTAQLIELRKGYFSISENDPDNDTDDVLQLTVQVDLYGGAGERLYGKVPFWSTLPGTTTTLSPEQPSLPTPPPSAGPPATTIEDQQNHPEYDDGIAGNTAGMSGAAEISWFLRGGNLFRSVLLIREPYSKPSDLQPPIDPLWAGTSPYADYRQFSTEYPSAGYPAAGSNPPRSFWGDFDYSAYRWPDGFGGYELQFHGSSSLSNNPSGAAVLPYAPGLAVPQSLGVPHLRFGHQYTVVGAPLEYAGPAFFGRYTVPERSHPDFLYPGTDWAPFDGMNVDPGANYSSGTPSRRGVDLMLSNVHSFDVEVWDDVVGGFVDLGHDFSGTNPYTGAVDEPGFYHASRLRNPIPKDPLAPGEEGHYDDSSVTENFGNRYDTWHPYMLVNTDWRNGRAPYRPQQSNPDPNTASFNDPTSTDWNREPAMEFGDNTRDDDGDFTPGVAPDTDAEAPLRAVRIIVRYLDAHSGQMRQSTIEASLID